MRLVVRCQVGDNSSYAFHSDIIIKGLQSRGYELCIIPYNQCAWKRRLPKSIDDCLRRQPVFDAPQLIIHPPRHTSDDPKRTIYSTMWETTRIDPIFLYGLNASRALIVPSEQNILTFSAQGVTPPMHQVPFGIDTDVFKPKDFIERDTLVFGTSGISRHGWPRKGFDEVIDAFLMAFPDEDDDVELRIKCYPRDPVPKYQDPRIQLNKAEWRKPRLAKWYESIDVFVCMSKGEGWGLMPHEAMACGRPSIIPIFFGLAGFCDQSVSFPVSYDLVPSTNYYEDRGLWANPSVEDAAAQMRSIYKNREPMYAKGKLGEVKAAEFTYDRMAGGYAKVIESYFGNKDATVKSV